MILGLVLAGGRSTRFGSEKAVAAVGGAPMVAHVADVLARGCAEVAVNAPVESGAADWARARGLAVLPDPPGAPDGPLAGVSAGLDAALLRGWARLATAPCDTPDLPADLVARLAGGVGGAPAGVAVARDGTHPLCALWSVGLREPLRLALAGGAHPPVRTWLRGAGAVEVRFPDAAAFRNLNRP